jgi:DNA polymerase IV
MAARRVIAHVDMDAFYVSVELQRKPELRGLPVVVAGTGPRAVVTTASYEARKFGVFSATPAERARRLCPDAIFIPPDHTAYRETSQQVMEVLREHIDRVEVVGLDEAYLDLTGLERPKAAARRVKQAVHERTGLVCSIGIGPSKLVAKVSSDAEKPNGFVVMSREQACERFAGHSPGLIPGIGPRTVERLDALEIRTLGDLAQAPEEALTATFGARMGPYLKALACFEDDREVTTHRPTKSESKETTFDYDLRGIGALTPHLDRLTEQLCETLAKRHHKGRTIGIKVRLDDFSTHTRAKSLAEPTNDLETIKTVATDLLREFNPPRPVRLIGVRVAGLDENHDERAGARSPGQLELAL